MADPMVEARVAKGRTVVVGSPGRHAGPGVLVKLPQSEVTRLRALGFLAATDGAPVVAEGIGPTYLAGNAVEVKEPT